MGMVAAHDRERVRSNFSLCNGNIIRLDLRFIMYERQIKPPYHLKLKAKRFFFKIHKRVTVMIIFSEFHVS